MIIIFSVIAHPHLAEPFWNCETILYLHTTKKELNYIYERGGGLWGNGGGRTSVQAAEPALELSKVLGHTNGKNGFSQFWHLQESYSILE